MLGSGDHVLCACLPRRAVLRDDWLGTTSSAGTVAHPRQHIPNFGLPLLSDLLSTRSLLIVTGAVKRDTGLCHQPDTRSLCCVQAFNVISAYCDIWDTSESEFISDYCDKLDLIEVVTPLLVSEAPWQFHGLG